MKRAVLRKIVQYVLTVICISVSSVLWSQNEMLNIFGQLKDDATKKKLENCKAQIFKDGSLFDTYESGTSGKYDFKMPLGHSYDIKFSKDGYAPKIIRIDTRNIPAEDRAGGFEINIDGFLFQVPDGFNMDILKEPVAKMAFESETNAIQFDYEYTERRQEVIAAELKRLEDLAKAAGKNEKLFDELVKAGDAKMSETKYTDAIAKYTEALKLFKDKEPAKSKLEEAKKKEAEANANKEQDAKYKKLIADGDAAFKSKNLKDAKTAFTEATKMKPSEAYPKQMLASIADEEAKAGKKAEFDKIVAEADAKFTAKKWQESIDKYNQALTMLPGETYPKDQIKKAQQEIANLANAEKENEAKYKKLVADGDAAFKKSAWADAKNAFTQAGSMKPSEQYPKDMLVKIAEEEKKAEKRAQYLKVVADADAKFKAGDYSASIDKYREASNMLPEEIYPKDQIAKAQKALDDQLSASKDAEAKELEAKYRKFLDAGDAAFKKKDWSASKTAFNEALKLKSNEQYPKDMLAKISEEEKKAGTKANYDKVIAEADAQFKSGNYSGCIDKYKEASGMMPTEAYPKDQILKAQKALDDQLSANKDAAAKELETKYRKFMDDGDAAFKKKNWKEARTAFTEAGKLKPSEQQPKAMLIKVDEEEKRSASRAEYDKIIADADAKFKNKDYAVAIERYRTASGMQPQESYPQDQIEKAQRELDSMLSDEAAKQKREANYKAKVKEGEDFYASDKLENALRSFRDASSIKPEEELPKKRITEIEKIIADRKKKATDDSAITAGDSEAARKEREYNEYVKKADGYFASSDWDNAKREYNNALGVKPEAQYPKQRLQRIDLLVSEADDRLAKQRQKEEEERLRRERAALMDNAGDDKAAILRQEKEDRERRWAELEEKRIQEYQATLESKKNNTWEYSADAQAEAEVEKYYKNALRAQEKARYVKVLEIAEVDSLNKVENREKQDAAIEARTAVIGEKMERKAEIDQAGADLNQRNIDENNRKKEENDQNIADYNQRSVTRQDVAIQKLEDKQTGLQSLAGEDRHRETKVIKMQDKKEELQANRESYTAKGNARITENNMKAEEKEIQKTTIAEAGETTRKTSEDRLVSKVETYETSAKDTRDAANEKVSSNQQKIDKKAEDYKNVGDGKDKTAANAEKIQAKRERMEIEALKSDVASAEKRYQNLNEATEKESGKPKKDDEVKMVPGTESLPEGVTENSYEQGNKKVTERIVKEGNKVNYYKKVVSKTGIFYFKNGRSITETIWKQETLKASH